MSFEVEGKLHKIFPVENKSGSFQAREFVIEVESGSGQYTQFVKFQLVQDKCSFIDEYTEGENIKVHFDLRGREWQGKYFTNLNAWRLERPSKAEKSSAPAATEDDGFPTASDERMSGGGGSSRDMDDLPF